MRILGDIMLDHWIEGEINRISPESPVPILLEHHNRYALGGAGNLAANLANLGHDIHLYGVIGDDDAAQHIQQLSQQHQIHLHPSPHTQTTCKHRLINRCGQQLLRWDQESSYQDDLPFQQLTRDLSSDDFVCISDYNKGIIQPHMCTQLAKITPHILVDPKHPFDYYNKAFLVKPNKKEFETYFGPFSIDSAKECLKTHGWTWLVITLAEEGLLLINNESHWLIRQKKIEVADVSGAGDVVLASICHLIKQGSPVLKAAELACHAAQLCVQKKGTSLIEPNDLKPLTIFTNGCFDILHPGHLALLKFAKTLGHRLIVGLNSDESIKRLKGPHRPCFSQKHRQNMLLSLNMVDDVILFDEDTPIHLIESLKPDIIVKGGDYQPHEVVGHLLAKTIIFPTVEGYSTTRILEKEPC